MKEAKICGILYKTMRYVRDVKLITQFVNKKKIMFLERIECKLFFLYLGGNMFHINESSVKDKIFLGNFGLEKESLRINQDGFLSQSADPFLNTKNIVKDFSESQCEINTNVNTNAKNALNELYEHTKYIQKILKSQGEYLWPFSNPPYIRSEKDILVARFKDDPSKENYRNYLASRYGKYKMSLSGIHINYSFSDELLEEDFKYSSYSSFIEYKNQVYLELAKKVVKYGWILTILCAASPILDSSFQEKGLLSKTIFNGMASVRCSELGYWNSFTPIFDYSNIDAYANSIHQYVKNQFIAQPSELYYPVRLKSKGENSLRRLKEEGVNHIELRNIDLNPFCKEGLHILDLLFVQYFLVWLACTPDEAWQERDQIDAIQNFKNAAHYDLKTVKILLPNESCSVLKAGKKILKEMKKFYQNENEILEVLKYQEDKFENPEKRYAYKVRKEFGKDFVKEGMKLAEQLQKEAI